VTTPPGGPAPEPAASPRPAAAGPRHVAIIMDGNGRWAARRGRPRAWGHRAGMEALERVVRAAPDLGVEVLTVYAFSTENWRRPAPEVLGLWGLLVEFLRLKTRVLRQEGVRLTWIGDISALPPMAQTELRRAARVTAGGRRLVLNLALNYGGRTEIVRAARKLAERVATGEISPADIDEALFEATLDSGRLPAPDLIVRTAGESRLSNFLLWGSAYSELVVTPQAWPDFDGPALRAVIDEYLRRERRFGGLPSSP
jgi:undecaprenyl diphosphate synthase